MKQLLTLLCLFICFQYLHAQNLSSEMMAGNKNIYYQHSAAKQFNGSTLIGFFHASSFHSLYEETSKNELMSQSYLTLRVSRNLRLAGGTFYASKPGISASLTLQSSFQYRFLKALLVPRIDLKQNGSYELMTLFDYNPPLNHQINIALRLQMMTNHGNYFHNRSYQNLRAGLKIKNTTFGLALNIDERGAERQRQQNFGLFLRYDFSPISATEKL